MFITFITIGLLAISNVVTIYILKQYRDKTSDRSSNQNTRTQLLQQTMYDEFGIGRVEDFSNGARRLILIRRFTVDEQYASTSFSSTHEEWNSQVSIIELMLYGALWYYEYPDNVTDLRRTSGESFSGYHMCWRVPGPNAEEIIKGVLGTITEPQQLPNHYTLSTDSSYLRAC